MKIVVAMDSFKGSLSSLEAGAAVCEGILRARPSAEIVVLPMADGGEGTVDALTAGLGGSYSEAEASGPLGAPVKVRYGRKGRTAFMEMAAAAGLPLVPPALRDGVSASTYGVGEMIAHALREGCREFILGIGGSATTDGGMGMLQALGWSFRGRDGLEAGRGAAALADVAAVDGRGVMPEIREAVFRVACDVDNPLCGPHGTAAVYGPQKGLSAQDIPVIDDALRRYASICGAYTGRRCEDIPGAGAAGGLGFACTEFLGAELIPGVDIVLDAVGIDEALQGASFAVTGEGRIDVQTAMGKAPGGVARRASAHSCRTIAFAGCIGQGAREANAHGIDAFFPILRTPCTMAEAMDPLRARAALADTAEQVFRLL